MMMGLDLRGEFQHQCLKPRGDPIKIQVGDKPKTNLPTNVMKNITKVLQDNKDIFAWVASDMPGVDQSFAATGLQYGKDQGQSPTRKGEWAKKEQRPLKHR